MNTDSSGSLFGIIITDISNIHAILCYNFSDYIVFCLNLLVNIHLQRLNKFGFLSHNSTQD
jgi:hypothetical protein